MGYKEAAFYFLSGTGNSHRVAAWLNEAAIEEGISPVIQSIDRKYRAEKPFGNQGLIGLVFPTHGFTAPWPMVRFALTLPRTKGTHAVILPTRAGTKIGPLFFPGLQGTAGYLLAFILALKGYAVRGVLGVDMPSNWTTLHWGLSNSNSRAIISRANKKVFGFFKTIVSGQRFFGFGGFIELLLGLLLLPVSLGYLMYGRIQLAKLFFASDRCNSCGVCAKNCPAGALKMLGEKPYWTYKCESCMRCMNFCPTKAVEASHPLIAVFVYVTGVPAADYLLNKLGHAIPFWTALNNGVTAFVLQYIYFIASVCFVYLLFSLLNRIKILSRIFGMFTLTHYYRRYHEPDTKVTDLSGRKS